MSKKILFFLLFAGFSCSNSFSQDLQIIYKVSTDGLLNEEQKKTLSKGSQNFFRKGQKNFKHLEFVLNLKHHQAKFFRNEKMENEGNRGIGVAASLAGFFGSYYGNSITGETISEYEGYGPKYLVSSSLKELEWKTSKETKLVNGFKTFKATAVETYVNEKGNNTWTITAWFAPEINKPFGPGGYGGLPGLILELDRGKKTYTASSIEEVTLKEEDVSLPKTGKKVTKKEFEAIGRKMSELRASYN